MSALPDGYWEIPGGEWGYGDRLLVWEASERRVYFALKGTPVAWRPPRVAYNPRVRRYVAYKPDDDPLRRYQEAVSPYLALLSRKMPRPLGERPLVASYLFVFPLPSNAAKRQAWTLKDTAPDLSNLSKALEDCLQPNRRGKWTVRILSNDARIARYGHPDLPHAKIYGDRLSPGLVMVLLEEMG